VVTDRIATNVIPGCKAAELSSECWHMVDGAGLPHEQISGIAVDPKNPSTIYVSLRQMIVMGADPKTTGGQKVMVSHDGGATFTDLTGNLPKADAHRIVLRNGSLYVATDVGVFTAKTGQAGLTKWSQVGSALPRIGSPLPQVAIRSMQLDPSGRYLVAGAYGRGGWVYDFGKAAASTKKVSVAATTQPAAAPPVVGAPAGAGAGVHPGTGATPVAAAASSASSSARYTLARHPGRSSGPLVLLAVFGGLAVVALGGWGGRRRRRRIGA
jgi:hypothetical protein